jgi:hypothetical protein
LTVAPRWTPYPLFLDLFLALIRASRWVSYPLTTVRLTNTEVEVRIGRVQLQSNLPTPLPAAVLTNLTLRLTNPNGRFLAIPRALRP